MTSIETPTGERIPALTGAVEYVQAMEASGGLQPIAIEKLVRYCVAGIPIVRVWSCSVNPKGTRGVNQWDVWLEADGVIYGEC